MLKKNENRAIRTTGMAYCLTALFVVCLLFVALPARAIDGIQGVDAEGVWHLSASNPFLPNFSYAREDANRPSFIKIVGEDSVSANPDIEQFCADALDINFRVNRTFIDPFSPSYIRLMEEGVPFIREHRLVFHHMEVRGGASPEGSYWNNARLARERAQALIDTLGRHVNLPLDNQFEIVSVPEDYEYLAVLVSRADDPDKEAILDIINRYRGDDEATKAALRNLKQGTVWKRLLADYYPALRSARVIFYFISLEPARPHGPVAGSAVQNTLPSIANVYYKAAIERLREPMLSVKTNLLYDAFFVPGVAYDPIVNVEAEYYIRNSKWSIVGEYEFPWWSNDEGMRPDSKHHYFQALNGQLEARRYFAFNSDNEALAYAHNGHYLSAYAGTNKFDFCLDSKLGEGVQGEGWGAGLGYGYVLPLGGQGSRWKLEFLVKAGYYVTRYDPYYYQATYDNDHQFVEGKYYYDWAGSKENFIPRNWRFRWFGPTGVGVTLSYDLLYRNVKLRK